MVAPRREFNVELNSFDRILKFNGFQRNSIVLKYECAWLTPCFYLYNIAYYSEKEKKLYADL